MISMISACPRKSLCTMVFLPLVTTSGGSKKERCDIIRHLVATMGQWDKALNIVLGDLNYVCHSMDRVSGGTRQFTGGSDKGEDDEMDVIFHDLASMSWIRTNTLIDSRIANLALTVSTQI